MCWSKPPVPNSLSAPGCKTAPVRPAQPPGNRFLQQFSLYLIIYLFGKKIQISIFLDFEKEFMLQKK
jgi:hypothetical protein